MKTTLTVFCVVLFLSLAVSAYEPEESIEEKHAVSVYVNGGKPVADAKVIVTREKSNLLKRPAETKTYTTDNHGRAVVVWWSNDLYSVRIESDKGVTLPAWFETNEESNPESLVFDLEKGGTVHGTVTVGEDRKPYAERPIRLMGAVQYNVFFVHQGDNLAVARTTTNKDGKYRFENVAPGKYYVLTEQVEDYAVAYKDFTLDSNDKTAEVDLRGLEKNYQTNYCEVIGRVVAENDPETLIENVKIWHRNFRKPKTQGSHDGGGSGGGYCVSKDGNFTLSFNVPRDLSEEAQQTQEYHACFIAPDKQTSAFVSFDFATELRKNPAEWQMKSTRREFPQTITLTKGTKITGTILIEDEDGTEPMAGITVYCIPTLSHLPDYTTDHWEPVTDVQTDDKGRFEIPSFPTGAEFSLACLYLPTFHAMSWEFNHARQSIVKARKTEEKSIDIGTVTVPWEKIQLSMECLIISHRGLDSIDVTAEHKFDYEKKKTASEKRKLLLLVVNSTEANGELKHLSLIGDLLYLLNYHPDLRPESFKYRISLFEIAHQYSWAIHGDEREGSVILTYPKNAAFLAEKFPQLKGKLDATAFVFIDDSGDAVSVYPISELRRTDGKNDEFEYDTEKLRHLLHRQSTSMEVI